MYACIMLLYEHAVQQSAIGTDCSPLYFCKDYFKLQCTRNKNIRTIFAESYIECFLQDWYGGRP